MRIELNALRDKDSGYVLKEAPNVEHSSEHTVTLSDKDVESIKGNGTIKGKGFDTSISFTRGDSDDVRFVDIKESLKNHVHPNPNGVGNGMFVSTGKPENNTVEKIHVTKYSEIEETKI